jgi:hypothetical protein
MVTLCLEAYVPDSGTITGVAAIGGMEYDLVITAESTMFVLRETAFTTVEVDMLIPSSGSYDTPKLVGSSPLRVSVKGSSHPKSLLDRVNCWAPR